MVAPQSRSWTWVHSTFLTDSSEGGALLRSPPFLTPLTLAHPLSTHSSGVWGRRTWSAHLPGVTLSPQTRTFLKNKKIGELPVAQTPLPFSQMYLLCVLFRLLILVVGLSTHRPRARPRPPASGEQVR